MYIIVGGLLAAFVMMGGVAYGFKHLIDRVETLSTENQSIKDQVMLYQANDSALREGLQQWEKASKEWQQTLNKLKANDIKAEEQLKALNDIFKKHDLEKLSKRKPGLIANRINRASIKHIRLLECETSPNGCENPKSEKGKNTFAEAAGIK